MKKIIKIIFIGYIMDDDSNKRRDGFTALASIALLS
ncbi:hypothetical protein LMOf2365_1675 [Listeria monocytogenes serotype 4b str. F2365]|nr:hypothetical protein LMOf2365_1675 [Listeria monocytogenes serotype 4b str. F2365]AFH80219.1 hypothetical protein MUO_08495 [Listeria monocytogenes 07PF0776]AGR07085.1 hypothetical protein M637_11255 [Listeria monocytogenes]ERH78660.1 hypothetical protein O174_03415 [Listeria monocytogenes serotype 4bV str. LS644]ERH79223.1 hypothetical protein O167_01245 [Listeria monocytogenes serotype 4bV str. LS642]ERH79894.1 hypothetical protein O171_03370 [Listeria monocytogenes serotype 4bV str. LS64